MKFFHLLIIVTLLPVAFGFVPLPGVHPHEYQDNDPVEVKVNTLSSTKTQLPYSYYSLAFCRPNRIENAAENLGEQLRGDKIQNSLYSFKMGKNEKCAVVCKKTLKPDDLKDFARKIDKEYRVNMIVDNLPVAMRAPGTRQDDEQQQHVLEAGFPLGLVPRKTGRYLLRPQLGMTEGKHYLYNHLRFMIYFHMDPARFDGKRIVGFEVEPYSIQYSPDFDEEKDQPKECGQKNLKIVPLDVDGNEAKKVVFTYDAEWKYSPIRWASRWDIYLNMTDTPIHWFSIVNSFMIVLFLSGMVAMILARTLRRDLTRYNDPELKEEAQEETGWKLVHGDVFRPPSHKSLLASHLGTGVQVFGMALVTMICAALGFLSPANRGALMIAMLVCFVLMASFAGYWSSRIYKMFQGTEWKRNTLSTALLFPGVIFTIYLFLNFLIWGQKSAGAVPFWTMFVLVALWFGVSVPLVFVGSYFGLKKAVVENPCRTNQIPRQIPDQPWYMRPVFSILLGGILPFGAVFIELFFILTSLFQHHFYHLFTFLFLVFLILILTCAEITVVLCYFQLCAEDYRWWWRSFLTAASSAIYLFAYSIYYFFSKLEMRGSLVSTMLYFGYMFIISYTYAILTGSIGFFACFWFVRKIYGALKVD